MNLRPSSLLRNALFADAAISGTTGLLMALGAGLLETFLRLPGPLALYAGLSCLLFAGLLVLLATRESLLRPAIWAVIAANALWATASILLVAGGFIAPTALGTAFVVAQALVVAAFAEAQIVGLRRSAQLA